MKITRSAETLAGNSIIVEHEDYCLILYGVGNCFSDSISEIIVELSDYNIDTISDEEVVEMFNIAKRQYDNMKSILNSDEI